MLPTSTRWPNCATALSFTHHTYSIAHSMPSLSGSRSFTSMFKPRKSKVDLTSYYLADASSSNEEAAPALQQIQWPYPGFRPAQSLIFSFSHPDPANSPATAFFLECLPDPVGVAYHGMQFIRTCLVFPGTNPPWRYREVHIKLADEDGLAWACDGVITISLRWASTIMKNFHKGEMDMAACCFEFKGVSE